MSGYSEKQQCGTKRQLNERRSRHTYSNHWYHTHTHAHTYLIPRMISCHIYVITRVTHAIITWEPIENIWRHITVSVSVFVLCCCAKPVFEPMFSLINLTPQDNKNSKCANVSIGNTIITYEFVMSYNHHICLFAYKECHTISAICTHELNSVHFIFTTGYSSYYSCNCSVIR